MFKDSIAPITLPLAPVKAPALLMAWFELLAVIEASFTAVTISAPSASTVVRVRLAVALTGLSPFSALETAGSPSKVSIALKKIFDGFQPTELKASTKVWASSPVAVVKPVSAVIWARLVASTVTKPVPRAVKAASIADARAPPCRTLVTAAPPRAAVVPPSVGAALLPPMAGPPEAVKEASTVASIVAARSARRVMSPANAIKLASCTRASTSEDSMFITTISPVAAASLGETL